MHSITVKNIPDSLYEKIKQSAKLNHRSINSEIIYCVEQYVKTRIFDTEAFLAKIEKIQKDISYPLLTEEFLKKAENEKRDKQKKK